MANWKAYILFATLLPLVKTGNGQGGYKLETTTGASPQQLYGNEGMSEEHEIKVGNRIEPVIFEPQHKIKLSRPTYKVTSYVDFKPYKQAFKQFGQYMKKFLADLRDPHYVATLYKAGTNERDPSDKGEEEEPKTFFTDDTYTQLTYKCRIQNQFIQLKNEADKVNQIYQETYKKFLRAIDHMEFHPTLGRSKTKSTLRLRRHPKGKDQTGPASRYTNQRGGVNQRGYINVKTS